MNSITKSSFCNHLSHWDLKAERELLQRAGIRNLHCHLLLPAPQPANRYSRTGIVAWRMRTAKKPGDDQAIEVLNHDLRGSLVSSGATLATWLYLMFATRSHRDWSPERNREVDR